MSIVMTGCELDRIVKSMYAINESMPLVDIPRLVDKDHVIYLQIEREDGKPVFCFDLEKDYQHIDLDKLAKINLKQYDVCEIFAFDSRMAIKQRTGNALKGVYKSAYATCEPLSAINKSLSAAYDRSVEVEKSQLYKIISSMKKMSSYSGCSIDFSMESDSVMLSISHVEEDMSYSALIDCGTPSIYGVKVTLDIDRLLKVLKIADGRIRLGLKTNYPLKLEWTHGHYKYSALIAPRIEPDD